MVLSPWLFRNDTLTPRSFESCEPVGFYLAMSPSASGIKQWLQWLIALSLIDAAIANCYYPNGTDRNEGFPNDTYFPINPGDDFSMCCSHLGDKPRSDGLCANADGSVIWRESCTDRTWSSPKCIKLCAGASPGNAETSLLSRNYKHPDWDFRHEQLTRNRPPDGQRRAGDALRGWKLLLRRPLTGVFLLQPGSWSLSKRWNHPGSPSDLDTRFVSLLAITISLPNHHRLPYRHYNTSSVVHYTCHFAAEIEYQWGRNSRDRCWRPCRNRLAPCSRVVCMFQTKKGQECRAERDGATTRTNSIGRRLGPVLRGRDQGGTPRSSGFIYWGIQQIGTTSRTSQLDCRQVRTGYSTRTVPSGNAVTMSAVVLRTGADLPIAVEHVATICLSIRPLDPTTVYSNRHATFGTVPSRCLFSCPRPIVESLWFSELALGVYACRIVYDIMSDWRKSTSSYSTPCRIWLDYS